MVMSAHAKPQPKSGTKAEVRTIPAGEFKAKCLQLMDEVERGGLTVVVTKRGRPVMQASAPMAAVSERPRSFIGGGKGLLTEHGDIVAALPNDWSALEDA